MSEPTTLLEAIQHFSDPGRAHDFVVRMRWPDGVSCPHCNSTEVGFVQTRCIWNCKGCKKQFSAKVGTIFEDSPIGLGQWLPAIWLICNAKNGISSYEISRGLGVTQKTAWFMLHRIALAMQTESFQMIDGETQVDETIIGGKARFMHQAERERKITGTGGMGKVAAMGLLSRHGPDGHSTVRIKVVVDRRRKNLAGEVRKNVKPGSEVYTDALGSYNDLKADYIHGVIDHAEKYAVGKVHTNGIEISGAC
jgi:transposase-like protein